MTIMIWFYLLMSLITKGSSNIIRYWCPNTNSYTPNSTYKANLDVLLSNLYSNATRDDNNGFYHTTVGRSGSNDTVYGLFLCWGDVSTDVCRNCVGDVRKEILEDCTNGTTAMIWYDKCMLRYSEKPMLGILDQSNYFTVKNNNNDTKPNAFMQLVGSMLDQIVSRASSGSSKKFAVLEANFSVFERVYALGQCTPDLSDFDCQICFHAVIDMLPGCCYAAVGARAAYPSCYIRYEIYPFYNLSAMAAPAPSPPPPPLLSPNMLSNSASSKGNEGKCSAKVIIIAASVVSVVTAMLLFVLC